MADTHRSHRIHPTEPRYTVDSLTRQCVASGVPEALHDGLVQYILTGRPCGHFLTAVLENNLYQACNRADDENRARLFEIVYFLTNYAPAGCWLRREFVDTWIAHRGLEGMHDATRSDR